MSDPRRSDPFRLAMEFEKIGQEFYAMLATASDSADVRVLFARLAKEEAGHYALFQDLRGAARGPQGLVDADAARDLMRKHILPSPQTVHEVALRGRREQVLNMARQMEEGSILFYRDLASAMPRCQGDLAKIIQEEHRHVELLTALLQAVPMAK